MSTRQQNIVLSLADDGFFPRLKENHKTAK